MTLVQVVGAAILVGVTMAAVRDGGGKLALFIGAGGGILLTCWAVGRLFGLFEVFSEVISETALSPYLTLLLKAIGVGYVVNIGADICRDLGAGEVAKRIELCGRVELLLLAVPPLSELLRLAVNMAEGT